jgi:hypothetical protein
MKLTSPVGMDDYFSKTPIVCVLSKYKPDYLGHGEEELRRGNVHVEAADEAGSPTMEKEKAEIEQQERKY